jgi:CRISPR-associated endonuclease/helicase Cas3
MWHRAFYAHSKPDSDTDQWQELRVHRASVAEHTSHLARKIGLAHAGELIGLAHDLGKYSQAFQQYLQELAGDATMKMEPDFSLKGSVDHSTAGAQIIGNGITSGKGGIASQMLALCVASHHSGLIDCIAPDGVDVLTRRLNKDVALSHRDEAWSQAEQTIRGRLEAVLNSANVASEIDAALAASVRKTAMKSSGHSSKVYRCGCCSVALSMEIASIQRISTSPGLPVFGNMVSMFHGRSLSTG